MKKTSLRVTLLLALVLSLTAWNMLRLWTSLAWRATLVEFAGANAAATGIISGAAWSVIGIVLAWIILQRKNWAAKALIFAAFAYSAWYWVERFFWKTPRQNELFAVIVHLILTIFILFATKSLSREAYEQKIENPTIE